MDKGSGLGAIWSALGNDDFRRYSYGNLFSYLAYWIQRVAVGWLTWQLTESPFWLGLMAFADLAPSVVLAPLAGAVADRIERLRAIRYTQGLATLQVVALALMVWSETITIGWLLALTFGQGVVMAFNQPLRLAGFPSLVERRHIPAAVSINSLIFNLARIGGPAGAGIMIELATMTVAFAVCALGYAAFIVALLFVKGRDETLAGAGKPLRNIPHEIVEGLRYSARHPGIGPVMIVMIVVSVFGRAFTELLPGFAAAVFGRGAEGLALLTGAMGVGAVIGGIGIALRRSARGLTAYVTGGILLFALSVLGFALAPTIWAAALLIVACGAASVTVGVGEQTLVQNAVHGAMRGRVMSLYGVIARAGPAIGALVMGGISEFVGLRWPVAASSLALLALWLWLRPRRARLAAALEGDAPAEPALRAKG